MKPGQVAVWLVGIVWGNLLHGVSGEYCMTSDPEPFRLYSLRTAYDDAREDIAAQDETPPGCEPLHMYLLSRHGSRFNSVSQQAEIRDSLSDLVDVIIDSPNELCDGDRDALRDWVPMFDPNEDTTVAPRGWRELNNIGERYKTRVPALLNRPYERPLYQFQHSNYTGRGDRTKDSARAFVEGVWGSNVAIQLEDRAQPDWLLQFYLVCEKYIEEVVNQPELEFDAFNTGPYMQATLRRMETRLGLEAMSLTYDVAYLMYESCRWEYIAQDGLAPLCGAFTPEDMGVFEYSQDLSTYWKTSYPHDISYEQACELVEGIVDNFRGAMDGNGKLVTGAFGHHTTMNALFTLLGLYRDQDQLTAMNFEDMAGRQWRTSLSTPMGSNAAFVLYKCDVAPEHRVKTFINEKLITLPQCEEPVCDLDEVMEALAPIADNCNVKELCGDANATSGTSGDVRCLTSLITLVIASLLL